MICTKCGHSNDNQAKECTACGNTLTNISNEEQGVGMLGVVLFCIPLVGAIMYFVWKDDKPKKAKTACYLALGGIALGIVIRVITSMGSY